MKSFLNNSPSYHREIDGLRALAVIGVVLYHANLAPLWGMSFKGGFLGVDIFFVISGYLITKNIISLYNSDRLSLMDFYFRRMRRIIPLLYIVVFISIAIAFFYFLPSEELVFSRSVLAVTLFFSNFFFASLNNYWDPLAEENPLLHTWSLAVEEQFYLVFPALLVLLVRKKPHLLAFTIGSLLAVFFIYSIYLFGENPTSSFYMLHARAYEFLLGAFLSVVKPFRVRQSITGWHMDGWLIRIGVLLIVMSFILVDGESGSNQVFFSLPALLGTSLIISYSKTKPSRDLCMLNNQYVRIVGIISYGIYLWHFIVFYVLKQFQSPDGDQVNFFYGMIAIVLLSCVTFVLVENPFRNKRIISNRSFIAIYVAASIALLSFVAYSSLSLGGLGRFDQKTLYLLSDSQHKSYTIDEYKKILNNDFYNNQRSGKKRVLIVGDSFSQDFYNVMLESQLFDEGFEFSGHFIAAACLNAPDWREDLIEQIAVKDRQKCAKTIRVGHNVLRLKIQSSDAVILASNWTDYTARHLPVLVSKIKSYGVKNVLVVGVKGFEINIPKSVADASSGFAFSTKVKLNTLNVNEFLRASDLIDYLDIMSIVCGDDKYTCDIIDQTGYPLFYDGYHLTQVGASYISKKISNDEVFIRFMKKLTE